MDPAASFAMPTSKTDTNFDLSEIDFDYVERLQKKDVLKLKKIIVALEQEGDYPDLQRACKDKLKQLDPKSSPPSFAAPSSEEAKDAVADLLNWASSAKEKDALLRTKAGTNVGSKSKPSSDKSLPTIRGHTDSAFEEDPSTTASKSKAKDAATAMNLGPELNPSKLSSVELSAAAILEKEKGNECFRAKEYTEAIKFYTRSLHLVANDSTTLNNRALAFLKSKNLDAALNDVSLVLQQEPSNFKALWRRGQVWEGKLFLERALDDFNAAHTAWQNSAEGLKAAVKENAEIMKSIRKVQQQLLEQEPNHPYVQHLKKKDESATAADAAAASAKKSKEQEESKEQKEDEGRAADKNAATTAANAAAVSKAFKRMAIAEVDDDEEDEEDEEQQEEAEEKSPAPKPAAVAPSVASSDSKPMKRVAIQEVEEDEEEDAVEQPQAAPQAKQTPAPAAVPAPQPQAVKKEVKKPAPTFHSKSGGVTIELVSDEEDEEEQKEKERAEKIKEQEKKATAAAAAASASSTAAAASPAKPAVAAAAAAVPALFVLPASPPATGIAFEKDWSSLLKQGTLDQQADYLRGIESQQYSKLFPRGKEMSSGVFAGVLSVIAQKLLPARSALETLDALSTMDRFALTVAMVNSKTKKAVRSALEQVSKDSDKELAKKLLSKY